MRQQLKIMKKRLLINIFVGVCIAMLPLFFGCASGGPKMTTLNSSGGPVEVKTADLVFCQTGDLKKWKELMPDHHINRDGAAGSCNKVANALQNKKDYISAYKFYKIGCEKYRNTTSCAYLSNMSNESYSYYLPEKQQEAEDIVVQACLSGDKIITDAGNEDYYPCYAIGSPIMDRYLYPKTQRTKEQLAADAQVGVKLLNVACRFGDEAACDKASDGCRKAESSGSSEFAAEICSQTVSYEQGKEYATEAKYKFKERQRQYKEEVREENQREERQRQSEKQKHEDTLNAIKGIGDAVNSSIKSGAQQR